MSSTHFEQHNRPISHLDEVEAGYSIDHEDTDEEAPEFDQQTQPMIPQGKKAFHHNKASTTSSGASANEFVRFTISGFIGTLFFYVLYESLYSYLLPFFFASISAETRSVVAWSLGYMLSVWIQFELHARIVFYDKKQEKSYWSRLGMTYLIYSFSMVFSTLVIYVCSSVLMLNHQIGWIVSNVSVGIINYFVVKTFM